MWQPPDNPDPDKILSEAVADGSNGRPGIALQKFLWFHAHATRYNRGLYGVRLSFALSYWLDLASRFEPAFRAFIRTRDETESKFLENSTNFELFHDIAALNRRLDEGKKRTANIFQWVACRDMVKWTPIFGQRMGLNKR
jgi:hypothetical protein